MPTSVQTVDQLQRHLAKLERFKTSAYVLQNGYVNEVQLTCDRNGQLIRVYSFHTPGRAPTEHLGCDTLGHAFSQMSTWYGDALIFPKSIEVEAPRHSELDKLMKEAWCQAITPAADDSLGTENAVDFRRAIIHHTMKPLLNQGTGGIKKWNFQLSTAAAVEWTSSQFQNALLKEANFAMLRMGGSNFDGANLDQANFRNTLIVAATFRGARMHKAVLTLSQAKGAKFNNASMKQGKLDHADFEHCDFSNADLTKADLRGAHLQSADISTAKLTDAKFDNAYYDEHTKLPDPFPQWSTLLWRGDGDDPFREYVKQKLAEEGCKNFDEFKQHVTMNFDGARLSNAFKMLKKERFQLFSQVDDTRITGVVKSQTNPDLVYACSIASDGTFFCGTQNLKPCGGLAGALCKHILVLTIGLAKSGQLDLTRTTKWIISSTDHDPKMNKNLMTEVLLKYKGAEAGEVDWRPTETIPEDYYAY